jgi:2,3-bisphosphoglycerate-independent phosphoglycerate mutase
MVSKPVCLVILDGWGIRFMRNANAVALAKTPNYDDWMNNHESSILDASEEAVGLQRGQMGNSEVGHLNMGAGRIVYQSITRINKAIADGKFAEDKLLLEGIRHSKEKNSRVHLVGLLGPGGVHSHINHLHALLDLCARNQVVPSIHLITDGRDTPPHSGIEFYRELETRIGGGSAEIGTISGRYYAMDRDNRWERIELAYNTLLGKAEPTRESVTAYIEKSYEAGVTDEFIVPALFKQECAIRDGDCVIFYNFRADRMRQLVKAFSMDDVPGLLKQTRRKDLFIITFVEYESGLPVRVLFPPDPVLNPLARILSENGMKQFHTAETEKYAHVTYFFNGGREEPFEGEDRALIPSPKVATYDLQPEMSAEKVAQTVLDRLKAQNDDFIVVNFANPDMVGHSGILEATIKAVEAADRYAGMVVKAVNAKGGIALVTADHGNAELMFDMLHNQPHTYHTTSPVPFVLISDEYTMLRPRGILADIAPTILELLGIPIPKSMTGASLIFSGSYE